MPHWNEYSRGGMKHYQATEPVYQWVGGEGPENATIMLIGEKPGKNEAIMGRPFVGAAGKILDMALKNSGLNREEIYVTNLVKEYTEYDKPTPEEVERDQQFLIAEIAAIRPSIIGTLGTYAAEWLLGKDRAGLERNHGIPLRGTDRWKLGLAPFTVIPCYHPAAGFYDHNKLALTFMDVGNIAAASRGILGVDSVRDNILELDYSEDLAWDLKAKYPYPYYVEAPKIAIDTESDVDPEAEKFRGKPWCLTYTVREGQSSLVKPAEERMLKWKGKVYLHNSLHDLPVLRRMGCEVEEGQFVDTMLLAYLLCLHPQGLKDLAYRLRGMEMKSYREVVGEASRMKAWEYLMGVDACEWPEAEEYVIVEGGVAKIKKPHSVNQRVRRIINDIESGKRNKKGEEVDPRDRWDKVDDFLKAPVVEVLGEMPEATLDDVPYKDALHYACRDSDATFRIAPQLEREITAMGLDRVAKIDHDVIPMFDRMGEVGIKLAEKEEWDKLEAECQALMGIAKYKIFQRTGATINPDSGDQCADLLFEQMGMYRDRKTKMTKGKTREATDDKALASLQGTKSEMEVVEAIQDYREPSKVISGFVNPLRRRAVTGDGRVHCTFRLTRVSSGRPSATNPNLLAIPVRSKLGKSVRDRFIASPGKVLVDVDLDQIEMREMADQSGDEGLIELFRRGERDVHTQTAADMFSVDYDKVQSTQRYAAKRVGFGVITGITGSGLLDQMNLNKAVRPDSQGGGRWTQADCDEMIEKWFNVKPAVKRYMEGCREEVREKGFARDRWGRIRYLCGIWSPMDKVKAEAERQAHSFKISASAQGVMKQIQKWIWDDIKGMKGSVEPLLQIYDSLLFEVDEGLEEQVYELVKYHMQSAGERLGYKVPIGGKGGYGKTWADVKD